MAPGVASIGGSGTVAGSSPTDSRRADDTFVKNPGAWHGTPRRNTGRVRMTPISVGAIVWS